MEQVINSQNILNFFNVTRISARRTAVPFGGMSRTFSRRLWPNIVTHFEVGSPWDIVTNNFVGFFSLFSLKVVVLGLVNW